METREYHRRLIVDEFGAVHDRMSQASTLDEKLYFFSAAFGVLNRVMNFEPDPVFIFAHQVLQTAHQAFRARATEQGPGVPRFGVTEEMITGLSASVAALKQAFEADDAEAIRRILQYVANLSYSTTGNGYYLYLKGVLDLTPP